MIGVSSRYQLAADASKLMVMLIHTCSHAARGSTTSMVFMNNGHVMLMVGAASWHFYMMNQEPTKYNQMLA